MTIYLYVKTHRKTGLKYLGKTVQDPQKYSGSGKFWKRHLRVHGYDVETEILRECQSNEEVRQWGLYYSELWQVVDSDNWANLKEEAGDGFTSEQARQNNLKRVADGTHNFLDSEFQRQTQQKRVEAGTHHFLDGEFARQNALKRVAEGTHNMLGGEIQRQNAIKRVEEGTHHFSGGEIQRQRVKDGTHPFLGGEIARQNNLKRVANGTHPFLGSEFQKRRVADGSHPSQTTWTCSHCGKSGKGTGLFKRWHGDNCKNK